MPKNVTKMGENFSHVLVLLSYICLEIAFHMCALFIILTMFVEEDDGGDLGFSDDNAGGEIAIAL